MKNPLRRLLPHSDAHLLMGRSGAAPAVEPTAAEGVEMLSIKDISDPAAGVLDAFAIDNGFPEGWAREMLTEAAHAVIARDAAGAALAMAWMTQRPFHVEEIGATIDPGRGVYLFGDFVAPAHRGRRLQTRLVAERLRLIGAAAAFACTLVHPTNNASLRSYQAQGFSVGGRFARYRWRGRTWARCRAIGNDPGGGVTFTLAENDRIVTRGS
jgi:ribosomal protein S18 acetylase RimI-like enzyme